MLFLIIIVVGIGLLFMGKTLLGLILIGGVVLFVLFDLGIISPGSDTGKGTDYTPPKRADTSSGGFSIDIIDGTRYDSYLSRLERITEDVITACPFSQIPVLVMVHKINDKYCSVSLSIDDYPESRNIRFGKSFTAENGTAQFTTDTATGFTTPSLVKDEILLQFNWYDIPKEITELTILDKGQFADNPLVICRFLFGPMNKS